MVVQTERRSFASKDGLCLCCCQPVRTEQISLPHIRRVAAKFGMFPIMCLSQAVYIEFQYL